MKALYEKAIEYNRTVVGMIGKDILTNSKRVVTYGHPINANGDLLGVIFQESDLTQVIERYWVPVSFQSSSLPFLEIKYPKKQGKIGESDDLLFRLNINDEEWDIMSSLKSLQDIHELKKYQEIVSHYKD